MILVERSPLLGLRRAWEKVDELMYEEKRSHYQKEPTQAEIIYRR